MATDDKGATVVPEDERKKIEQQMECPGDGTGGRYKHAWKWKWVNNVWLDEVECATCGGSEVRKRS
jgi:hypothetical protein